MILGGGGGSVIVYGGNIIFWASDKTYLPPWKYDACGENVSEER